MSYIVTHIKSNTFHVTDENEFKHIMDNVCVRDLGELDIHNIDDKFEFTASDDILGFASNAEDPDYDYDAFIHALQTVIPTGDAIIIYTTYCDGGVEAECDVITSTGWKRGNINDQALAIQNEMLSAQASDEAYHLDMGVLTDIDFDNGAYSCVYDKKYGYYDEDMHYVNGLENAKNEAREYVSGGVNTTYAIVSETNYKYSDIDPDECGYDESHNAKSVVYSIAKIDGKIVENFVDITVDTSEIRPSAERINNVISKMSEDTFREKVIQYALDCGTGIAYTEENKDGSHNYTTEREKAEKPAGTVRYIKPETIEWFMSPKILSKTKYVIGLRELEYDGHSADTDLINFDEWVSLCNIFNCPEMTLNDALTINGVLGNYDITPLEFDSTGSNDALCFDKIKPFICEQCEKLGLGDACYFCSVRRIHEHYHPEKDNT